MDNLSFVDLEDRFAGNGAEGVAMQLRDLVQRLPVDWSLFLKQFEFVHFTMAQCLIDIFMSRFPIKFIKRRRCSSCMKLKLDLFVFQNISIRMKLCPIKQTNHGVVGSPFSFLLEERFEEGNVGIDSELGLQRRCQFIIDMNFGLFSHGRQIYLLPRAS